MEGLWIGGLNFLIAVYCAIAALTLASAAIALYALWRGK